MDERVASSPHGFCQRRHGKEGRTRMKQTVSATRYANQLQSGCLPICVSYLIRRPFCTYSFIHSHVEGQFRSSFGRRDFWRLMSCVA